MGRKKRANSRGIRVEIVPGLKTDEPRKTEVFFVAFWLCLCRFLVYHSQQLRSLN